MRIGIDVRSLHYEGVGRYILELTRHLALIDQENEYILYFLTEQSLKCHQTDGDNFRHVVLPVPLGALHLQPYVYASLRRDRVDVFHATDHWLIPCVSPCPIVSTIHDILIYAFSKHVPYRVLLYGLAANYIALFTSRRVLTVSEYARREIVQRHPWIKDRIVSIYHGVGKEFSHRPENEILSVKHKYGISGDYLFFAGSLKPHKNIPVLIKAFSMLSPALQKDTELVIAARIEGRFMSVFNLAQNSNVRGKIKLIGYVPNADLPALYSGAAATVLPSLTECFGMPLLEAMACGSAVIAARVGALPEVCASAGIYFDPESISMLVSRIEAVLTNDNLRADLRERGLRRSSEFSWKHTAREVLKAYESVSGSR